MIWFNTMVGCVMLCAWPEPLFCVLIPVAPATMETPVVAAFSQMPVVFAPVLVVALLVVDVVFDTPDPLGWLAVIRSYAWK